MEQNSNNIAPLVLTQKDAAKLMNISVRKLFDLRRRGLIATVKNGRNVGFLMEDVRACIMRLRQVVTAEAK